MGRLMSAPYVFDRPLMRRRFERALREGYADFLVERAAEDLRERLDVVLRDFPLAVDIATPTQAAAKVLRADARIGSVVRLAHGAEPGAILGDEERLPFGGERFDL